MKRPWFGVGLVLVAVVMVGGTWMGRRQSGVMSKLVSPMNAASATPPDDASLEWETQIARVRRIADGNQRSQAFGNLVRQWYERDPALALDRVQHLYGHAGYTQGLMIVLESIGKNDPERALRLARDMAGTRRQNAIYSVLFAQLATADPARAVTDLGLVPAGESRATALRALASAWALNDAPAALAWAQGLDADGDRPTAMASVLTILADLDPTRAISLARESLTGENGNRVVLAALRRLSEDQPEAAGALIVALSPGYVQTCAALDNARSLAAREPTAALAWIDKLPGEGLHQTALNNVLDIWSRDQPRACEDYVAALPAGPAQDTAAAHLAADLGTVDPANAIAWANTLDSSTARSAALVSVASAWARGDAADASHWAASLPPDDPARAEALGGALSYWVASDAAQASAWVRTLPDADQPRALLAVTPTLAQNDPASAVAWAQDFTNEDIRALALDGVITRWADNDPPAAARWVADEPAGNGQVDHVRTVTAQWMAQDAASAVAWAKSLPAGPSRDAALDMAAAQLTVSDPQAALALAGAIGATALREARLGSLGP